MNAFLFQSVPDRFDLRQEIRLGEEDVWYATRWSFHPRSLKARDPGAPSI